MFVPAARNRAMLNLDSNRFNAEIVWKLKLSGNVSPLDWEEVVAYGLGGKVYGGDMYLADVIVGNSQISVKSLRQGVIVRKTMKDKNIFTHPLDTLEVIERRVSIPVDPEDDPAVIGREILRNQKAFEELSAKVYRVENTYDFLISYGYDNDENPRYFGYRVHIFRRPDEYDPDDYIWERKYFGENSKHAGKIARILARDKNTGKIVFYWNTPYNSRQTINLVHYFDTKNADMTCSGKIRMPERFVRPSDEELVKEYVEASE
jgi:hypothetical protein